MLVDSSIPTYMSFMNSTNNNGPKMEPWGTPDKTVILSEATLSRTTLCFLH